MGGSIRKHPINGGGTTTDPILDMLKQGYNNPADKITGSEKANEVLFDDPRHVEPGFPAGWEYAIEPTGPRTSELYLIVNGSDVYDCGTIHKRGGK